MYDHAIAEAIAADASSFVASMRLESEQLELYSWPVLLNSEAPSRYCTLVELVKETVVNWLAYVIVDVMSPY